jgi:ATP synthase protein I
MSELTAKEAAKKAAREAARGDRAFAAKVGAQAARKLKARRDPTQVWFGLGMMGLIGWSVAVPTVLGAALGLWLDKRHPGTHSWTLPLLVGGLVLGCLNAWHWVAKEDRAMQEDDDE